MGLFATLRRHPRPPVVPTDRIIPMRFWDDLPYLQSLAHDFTFRFDDVLDVPKMRAEVLCQCLHLLWLLWLLDRFS